VFQAVILVKLAFMDLVRAVGDASMII